MPLMKEGENSVDHNSHFQRTTNVQTGGTMITVTGYMSVSRMRAKPTRTSEVKLSIPSNMQSIRSNTLCMNMERSQLITPEVVLDNLTGGATTRRGLLTPNARE